MYIYPSLLSRIDSITRHTLTYYGYSSGGWLAYILYSLSLAVRLFAHVERNEMLNSDLASLLLVLVCVDVDRYRTGLLFEGRLGDGGIRDLDRTA